MLLVACVVTSLLLIVNRMIVIGTYEELVPAEFDYPKLRTIMLFVAIVGLLLPEWWMIDWATGRLRRLYKAVDSSKYELDD